MWMLDYKESWVPKNWCFWSVVLGKTLESCLDSKEIQPVHPKGDQSWVFIGRADAEAETPILWPPDVKNWLIGKDPDAGKDWRQEEREMTEDEMVGWHHQLNLHEFEELVMDKEAWHTAVHGDRVRLDWATELTDSGLILNTQLLYSFCLQNIYSFAKKYLKVNTHLCSIFNFMQIFPPKLWMY